MKISTIKPLQSGRCRVMLSDGRTLTLEKLTVADCGLYQGLELSQEDLDRVQGCNRQASAKARAVRITASTALSEKELRRRLRLKGEEGQAADEAVDWLKDLGAVDDRALAGRIVQQAQAKGYGKARIRQILYQKGVPKEYWDEALETLAPGDEAIDRYLQRQLGGRVPDREEQQKAINALRRRGFGWEEIRRGLDRYGADLEELE